MYVIWITFTSGANGYFSRFDDSEDILYVDSIYDARKFPTKTAAESLLEAKIRHDWEVSYTEIIKYNHDC